MGSLLPNLRIRTSFNGKVHGISASYQGLGVSWWFDCVLPNSQGPWGATLKSADEVERLWVETRKLQILPNFCPVFRSYNIRHWCPDWSWKISALKIWPKPKILRAFLALKWVVTETFSDYLYSNHFTVIRSYVIVGSQPCRLFLSAWSIDLESKIRMPVGNQDIPMAS